ncbi:DUF6520 family protein [Pedobacter chitinilyticus]|uniref:Uncharacterized protein n=1 Tax=Pedobacter chitinilyticus TaxID=2233776 RepID=A0A3S4RTM0_9SPHI|nr:DUF6520 family protein [Pedobacter chitinilyticus]RWU10615.1 hypothetical protein DPV69_04555 [Pedobacter chitinilyticus]
MKTNKFFFGLAALILAFGLVFITSAFIQKDPTYLAYQYTGDDESGVMSTANWTPITYNPTPTECDAEGELVCVVQFEDVQFANIASFLSNYSNAKEVNKSSFAKRHKEAVNH